MCKGYKYMRCSDRKERIYVTYKCSRAKASHSAYCSGISLSSGVQTEHDGGCVPDGSKYRMGSGRPPNNIYYKRCDGYYRNALGQNLL